MMKPQRYLLALLLLLSFAVYPGSVAGRSAAIVATGLPAGEAGVRTATKPAAKPKAPRRVQAKKTPKPRSAVKARKKRRPRAVVQSPRSTPVIRSEAALVVDRKTGRVLYEKNAGEALPIASITKLMTALVVVEAKQNMRETLTVTQEDVDRLKYTSSRLRVGARLSRSNMLRIALMSSENRAASALGRHYPGGERAFVAAMNRKAADLGMTDTRYAEPTGLSSANVSTARDLVKLVIAASRHPVIRRYSTNRSYEVDTGAVSLHYTNSNRLITQRNWPVTLQKTGYISEAGRCVVMQTRAGGKSVVMVLLNAPGRSQRVSDAVRLRQWLGTPASRRQ